VKKIYYLYNSLILLGILDYMPELFAEEFDTTLLVGKSAQGDISRFYRNSEIPPGKQLVDIYVNDDWKGQFEVNIGEKNQNITIDAKDINKLGLKLSAQTKQMIEQKTTVSLDNLVNDINYYLDVNQLALNISVPQISLVKSEIGYVDPVNWDYGVPAIILSYNTNYYNYREKKNSRQRNEAFFTNLNSGINIGAWQFRDESSYSYYSSGDHKWQNNTRYLRRSFSAISSNLMLGDFYSPSTLFSSIRFRGGALTTEMNMLPNSSQEFTPIVRGVAQTNALVKVYQNGNLIYQEAVPPGAFEFSDLRAAGGAGDLSVVVQEADGRQDSFTVPFSAVPNMMKAGVYAYNILAGQSKMANTYFQPKFAQAEAYYGINNLVTVYAGFIGSRDYNAILLGSGWNFPFGAVSFDATHAAAYLDTGTKRGQSFRLAYSKFLSTTATNLTIAAYRYSTGDYYSFIDSIYAHDNYQAWLKYQATIKNNLNDQNRNNPSDLDLATFDALRGARARNTFNLNLNQHLGKDNGVIFLAGTLRNYWNVGGTSREYQIGYSNNYKNITYNLSVSRVRNTDQKEETRYYLSASVPINLFSRNAYLNSGIYMTNTNYQQANISVSGTAGKYDLIDYTLTASNQTGGNNLISGSVNYRNPYSTVGASYSEANNYRQTGLNARGTIVAFPYHILASGETANTLTVIEAPMAENLTVNNNRAVLTNKQGLALVTNATPYRTNVYTLSHTNQTSGAEITDNVAHVIPYDGAVSHIKLETDQRKTYMLKATFADGSYLPFGTEVTDSQGEFVGHVGQSSVLYIKSDQLPQSLNVKLNIDGKTECIIQQPVDTLNLKRNICQ
jgi:outer membrane usher protein